MVLQGNSVLPEYDRVTALAPVRPYTAPTPPAQPYVAPAAPQQQPPPPPAPAALVPLTAHAVGVSGPVAPLSAVSSHALAGGLVGPGASSYSVQWWNSH